MITIKINTTKTTSTITGTSTPTATVNMTGIMTAGKITSAIAHKRNANIIGGSVTATMTMATIAKDRFTTAIPRAIRAAVFTATPVAAIPAAGMATPAQCMAAPAVAGMQPTASAIRMAATWPAGTDHRTSGSIPIRATSTETGPTATTVHSATRTTTGPSTAPVIQPATNRIIAEEEAGRSSTWQLVLSYKQEWPLRNGGLSLSDESSLPIKSSSAADSVGGPA